MEDFCFAVLRRAACSARPRIHRVLSFHTEVLTTNWLPVELLKPTNAEANAPECPCRAEGCVQPQCSLSARLQLPSSRKDPSIKDPSPAKNQISIRLKDESFVLPVSNFRRGRMKVDLLEAQPQSSGGHLATKRDHGPLSGREP